jgi:hypothetical protein
VSPYAGNVGDPKCWQSDREGKFWASWCAAIGTLRFAEVARPLRFAALPRPLIADLAADLVGRRKGDAGAPEDPVPGD